MLTSIVLVPSVHSNLTGKPPITPDYRYTINRITECGYAGSQHLQAQAAGYQHLQAQAAVAGIHQGIEKLSKSRSEGTIYIYIYI